MNDPVNYIFGIIAYIKKIKNDMFNNYINNNNNNYINNNNSNILNEINGSIIKVVGPCVRSILLNKEYTHISLVISSYKIHDELVSILRVTDVLTLIKSNGDVDNISFIYKNKTYTMEIVSNIFQLELCKNKCMLTCNNLTLDFDGNISTVYNSSHVNDFINTAWITSCFRDIMNNKFRTILLENMESLEKIIEYNEYVQRMINAGFVYDRENSKNLTNYKFTDLKSHLTIAEFTNREVSQCCSICHEKYEDELSKKTILTGCLHDFHIDCLQKWINRSANYNCPVCRCVIKFEYPQLS